MIDETLRGVVREGRGVEAVLLTGTDGVIVAASGDAGGLATDAVAAAFADLFSRTGGAHRDAGLPPPEDLSVGAPPRRVVVRVVTDEYVLLAILDERGIVGQTRHLLARAALQLEPELI